MSPKENERNISLRSNLESAVLPNGTQITAEKQFHIQEILRVVTEAREQHQPFSLQQIVDVFDQSPENYDRKRSRIEANKWARHAIYLLRSKTGFKSGGWVIDTITSNRDAEERENPRYWFRHKNEPPFASPPDARVLAKEEILLPNGEIIQTARTNKTRTIIAVIKEVLSAQQNNIPYMEIGITNKRSSGFLGENRWIKDVVRRANKILNSHGFEFISSEINIGDTKTRAFNITEIKAEETTFSAETESPKAQVRS